jgi:hypothetical protein
MWKGFTSGPDVNLGPGFDCKQYESIENTISLGASMLNLFRLSFLGLVSAAAFLPAPATALDQYLLFSNEKNSGTPATGRTELDQFVDFSTTPTVAGHNTYGTMDWGAQTGVKFLNYTSYSGSNQPGRCFQINTKNVLGSPQPIADPIILVKSGNAWVKLADDVHDGSYAEAYIWFYGGSNTRGNAKIRVAAYRSGHNTDAFMLSSNWTTDDMTACLDGLPNYPDYRIRASATVDGLGNVTINRIR